MNIITKRGYYISQHLLPFTTMSCIIHSDHNSSSMYVCTYVLRVGNVASGLFTLNCSVFSVSLVDTPTQYEGIENCKDLRRGREGESIAAQAQEHTHYLLTHTHPFIHSHTFTRSLTPTHTPTHSLNHSLTHSLIRTVTCKTANAIPIAPMTSW